MRYNEIINENTSLLDAAMLIEKFNGIEQDIQDVSEWMRCSIDALRFRLVYEPATLFLEKVKDAVASYDEFPRDRARTNKIIKLIKNGSLILPVFIEDGDHNMFIMEGRHRIVAFLLSGLHEVPVAYVTKIT